MSLNPELVEKKDPPIITKIKKTIVKFDCSFLIEKPILDILLETDNKLDENSLLKLKNKKKIVTTITK